MSRGLLRSTMMASRGLASQSEPYDLAVLGGGPGGYVAAIKAAQSGLKVGHLSAKLRYGQRFGAGGETMLIE